jgi:hypothetical protein
MKRPWLSSLTVTLAVVGVGGLIVSAIPGAAPAQEQAGEAARGAAGAITGSGGGLGGVIVVGVVLYSAIFILSGLYSLISGLLGRDRRKIDQGIEGVSGGLGCLLVGAIVIGAFLLVNYLLFRHGR